MPGPLLSDSKSLYKSPSYKIDTFPSYVDGKTSANNIYASAFNKLASAIYATQSRAKDVAATYARDFDYTKAFYFVSTSTTGATTGVAVTSGSIVSDYFYGGKLYNDEQAFNASCRNFGRWSPSNGDGPIGLRQCPSPTRAPQYLGAQALEPTPRGPRLTNDAGHPDDGAHRRVIIGSSRAQRPAVQFRSNREVYRLENNWPAPTGMDPKSYEVRFPTPTGYVQDNKDLLGPGALFVGGGVFWVPSNSSWNINDDVTYKNRLACHVTPNSGPLYAKITSGYVYAHAIVFGDP